MTEIAQTYPQLAVQLTGVGWSSADLTLVRRAYTFASTLFAASCRGSGKPFVDHLVGTASCLVLDGAAAPLVAAGLLHAAYDQGDFGDGRRSDAERHRARVRAEVGDEVEAIVAAYLALGWGPTVASRTLATLDELPAVSRDALRVRLANEVDEALDGGLVLSGKATHPARRPVPVATVLALAERVAGPAFVACARAVLDAPTPDLPAELVIGGLGSEVLLPLSAHRDARVRVVALARAVRGRLPARSTRRTAGAR